MSITYEQLGVKLRDIAQEKSEWAGLPIPIDEHPLKLEPRFPYQFKVCKIDESQQGGFEVVNSWWNERYRCNVHVVRDENGKLQASITALNPITMAIGTMFCSSVWLVAAEEKAHEKLHSLVGDWKFRSYLLTGSFLETSKRSGVTYMFRKLRPTLAFRDMRVLCGMCLHCIGYYEGTWAGAMVPTDEVIAHLVMMRGSEEKFWANSNQHPANHPASGL